MVLKKQYPYNDETKNSNSIAAYILACNKQYKYSFTPIKQLNFSPLHLLPPLPLSSMEDHSVELITTPLSSSSSSSSSLASSSFYLSTPILPASHKLTIKNLSFSLGHLASCPSSLPFNHPKPTEVLKSISFSAQSGGELLAIVGPSGAGKSTLLRIVSGRVQRSSFNPNSISFDGMPLKSPGRLRRLCGFVTQEDNLLPLLTVKETLMFSAKFRLKGVSSKEREERVRSLMEELGLHHIANSYVGDEEIRGISGGEKKRLSIGVDVIHNPPILLLDEPTSGLDSSSALQVIDLLTSMSRKKNQILILTIHQPSYRILKYISTFLLLSRGRVAHFGDLLSLKSSISNLGYTVPLQLNPLEFAMEIINQLEEQNTTLANCNASEETGQANLQCTVTMKKKNNYCSRFNEVGSLSWRFWKLMYRTKQLFLARTAQAIVGSFSLGSIYFNLKSNEEGVTERLGFLAFTLSFLLSSTVEALPIFLQERRVIMRESSRKMYRLSSYMLANTVVTVPFLLVVAILFAGPAYWLVGLNPNLEAFLFFVMAVWLIVLMASSLVLFLSAVASDYVVGNYLICLFLGVFFLFSGYFIGKESLPKYWLFMYYVSLYRYPLDALVVNEYWSEKDRCFKWLQGEENSVCVMNGGDVLRSRGLERDIRWENVGIMCGFFLIYRVLCWVVLVRRSSRTML
ncbi:ABC transporter G family member 23 [Dendrobium catenatum]|uniref:ABC transporter G family member 23 n=1 Tax=Dendrobium catenatum TaxID=906689 RepID=UPI0010A04969|nr:ABC transporter G family member 23 [Dendrobium catenatum]